MPSPLLSIRASHCCLKHQRLDQPRGRGPRAVQARALRNNTVQTRLNRVHGRGGTG